MNTKPRHLATEQLSFDEILDSLPIKMKRAEAVFARLHRVADLPDGAKVLDIGAAAGGFVAAGHKLGYECEGVEPWDEARATAEKLSAHLGVPIRVVEGTAESIPYEDETFDIVHASSVIEHVLDVEKTFSEVNRVLKPGGVFWFSAASSMCPVQREIRGFPLFGWYPDGLKLKIMNWVKDAKPHLVGYSKTPAINWFTTRKAREMLRKHGFGEVYDRWELRGEDEGGAKYKMLLRIIRSSPFTKALADAMTPMCSFAAIKRTRSTVEV